MTLIRLLVKTRDQVSFLELVLWKLWGLAEDPKIRARNRLFCVGIDTVIKDIIPFLCGVDAPLFSFCFSTKRRDEAE
jgi:hypothetical protein